MGNMCVFNVRMHGITGAALFGQHTLALYKKYILQNLIICSAMR